MQYLKKIFEEIIAKNVLSMEKDKNLPIQTEPSTDELKRNPHTQTRYNLTAGTKEKIPSEQLEKKNDIFSMEKLSE